MALVIFNSLGNKKEEFVPLKEGEVRMYVCGVTVYDLCHLGHARANIVFDFIYRYLTYRGYRVTYVRNFTDIDDKIINKALDEGVDFTEISERYIGAFKEDMGRLGLLNPTHEPRATQHIEGIVEMVKGLIDKGYAYEVEGDVFYSVDSFSRYGALSGRNTEELLAGARVDVDERKKNPLDFALWKRSKELEPSWDSPWGPGRPGWHIECSVMSMSYLGDTFDIHGGGKDLVFPHHENEIAQSEANSGKSFAKYWIHNGFVNINKEKMSKSLGNFFTIREVLKEFHPEVIRFFFSSNHYRSPIDFSDKSIMEAKAGLDRLYNFYARYLKARDMDSSAPDLESVDEVIGNDLSSISDLGKKFNSSMDDDFNTAAAIGHVFDALRKINRIFPQEEIPENEGRGLFVYLAGKAVSLLQVLGLLSDSVDAYFRYGIEEKIAETGISLEEILSRIRDREEARKSKDFSRADGIRENLGKLGIVLEDTKSGTFWKFKDD